VTDAAAPPLSADAERALSLTSRLGLAPGSLREDLALEALRHSSWLHEQRHPVDGLHSNERLEFLGDSVLGLLISQRVCDRFPTYAEGALTRMRAALVNAEALAGVARSIGLGELLLLGRGEERGGGRDKQNLLADAVEASIAAVFLSSGLAAAGQAVDHLFTALFEAALAGALGRDHKTELQERVQSRYRAAPTYQTLAAPGPEHARTFEVEVGFRGTVLGRGQGRSKKDAEQAAARVALARVDLDDELVAAAARADGAVPSASTAFAAALGAADPSAAGTSEPSGATPQDASRVGTGER
jgi:ribonuclease-3